MDHLEKLFLRSGVLTGGQRDEKGELSFSRKTQGVSRTQPPWLLCDKNKEVLQAAAHQLGVSGLDLLGHVDHVLIDALGRGD